MTDVVQRSSPTNLNNLHEDKFRLVFMKIPTVQFFFSAINLPGIHQNAQELPNPSNKFFVSSNKVTFESLKIKFRVDEDLLNYIEIFNWIKGITSPTDSEEFRTFIQDASQKGSLSSKANEYKIYSDATLMTLTNTSNRNVSIFFKDMFPTSLTGLEFTVEGSDVMNAAAEFVYTSYSIEVRDP
jgi:hypothetical protein